MRVILVGADHEENLGVAMVGAAAGGAGHQVEILPLNQPQQVGDLSRRIAQQAPDVVGLSIQFQHRAREFLLLSRSLRAEGYKGHITCGGQLPSAACCELLEGGHGLDSVVLHDGELSFVALLEALSAGRPLVEVPGLALLTGEGQASLTPEARPVQDLDELPFPRRYRPHTRHLGLPFIPILGSRGCWGRCSFCSIAAHYRAAGQQGRGRLLRWRSPRSIAAEMAQLARAAGTPAIFCFHDDNFLLPRPEDSLRRVQEIRRALDELGVGQVGIIGKCRPDSITPELARDLADLGVVRMFVGVENVSQRGSDHLGRGVQIRQVQEALSACRDAGIFGCYNLLVFEPGATLEDVAQNVAFIRDNAHQPVNFCRAEPYHGTPLYHQLRASGSLTGSILGYDYRIDDDRVELMFRICAAAFRARNFAPDGVHNRYMGLGYFATLIERFFDLPHSKSFAALREAEELTREIALQTAGFLEEALDLARTFDPARKEAVERATARLGIRIAAADREQHARLDAVYARMERMAESFHRRAAAPAPPAPRRMKELVQRVAQGIPMGALLTACAMSLNACHKRTVVDPVPSDGGRDVWMVDPPPPDAGGDDLMVDPPPPDSGDVWPVDPPPWDMGVDLYQTDSVPDSQVDVWPVDPPPPPDVGLEGGPIDPPPPPPPPWDAGMEWGPIDPPPPPPPPPLDGGMTGDPLPSAAGAHKASFSPGEVVGAAGSERWTDPSPRRIVRSADLPLFNPPQVSLAARPVEGGAIEVRVAGGPAAVSLHWEGDGEVEGEGRLVLWRPRSGQDQIRAAARTAGGVAVVALRARDVGWRG